MKPHERVPAAMAHLLSLPPLWGVLFAAGVSDHYRLSSRSVAFQARQAIFVHLVFLGVALAGILTRLLAGLLDAAFPGYGLESVAAWFDRPKGVGLYIAFCFCAVLAATLNSLGHNVSYPFIGRRLWGKPSEIDSDELYG